MAKKKASGRRVPGERVDREEASSGTDGLGLDEASAPDPATSSTPTTAPRWAGLIPGIVVVVLIALAIAAQFLMG